MKSTHSLIGLAALLASLTIQAQSVGDLPSIVIDSVTNVQSVVTNVPVATNVNAKLSALAPDRYPEGRIFNTITNGMGRMSAYGYQIPVRDRWAIIAYVRTLQAAKQSADPTR